MQNTGKLYVVSTPIGNMRDVTLRALDVLKAVKHVAAEDTREMGKFFAYFELPKPNWISYRDQNHPRASAAVIALLRAGEDVALVSDRGTPGISDPGYKLVRDAIDVGFDVVAIPGPSAAIAALTISGLPTDRFVFLGFLPRQAGKQAQILRQFSPLPASKSATKAAAQATFIIYESPYRVLKLLEVIYNTLGDINITLAHELTKVHEGVIRGKASELIEQLKDKKLKGEWVVMGRTGSLQKL